MSSNASSSTPATRGGRRPPQQARRAIGRQIHVDGLPENWVACVSDSRNSLYFHNKVTGESLWQKEFDRKVLAPLGRGPFAGPSPYPPGPPDRQFFPCNPGSSRSGEDWPWPYAYGPYPRPAGPMPAMPYGYPGYPPYQSSIPYPPRPPLPPAHPAGYHYSTEPVVYFGNPQTAASAPPRGRGGRPVIPRNIPPPPTPENANPSLKRKRKPAESEGSEPKSSAKEDEKEKEKEKKKAKSKKSKRSSSQPPKPSKEKSEAKVKTRRSEGTKESRSRSQDVEKPKPTLSNFKIPKKSKPAETETTVELMRSEHIKSSKESASIQIERDPEIVVIGEKVAAPEPPHVPQLQHPPIPPLINAASPIAIIVPEIEMADAKPEPLFTGDCDVYEPMEIDHYAIYNKEQCSDDEQAEEFQLYDKLKCVVVFDTCSLLCDPQLMEDCVFRGIKVVIPRKVLDELDYQQKQKDKPHIVEKCREFHRIAVELLSTKLLIVEKENEDHYIPRGRRYIYKNDDLIIKCAEYVRDGMNEQFGRGVVDVYFVTEDKNCRLRADSCELKCFNNEQLRSFMRSNFEQLNCEMEIDLLMLNEEQDQDQPMM